ncbi:hypothetical protein J132_05418 [Termitomyces sp. J132]|nr:hypothetical protein J132_05418 [Termitomyces sp. J132]
MGSGKHHAHPSLLSNEHVAQARDAYKGNLNGQITPLKLAKQEQVNDVIIPLLGLDLGKSKISENCARQKGIYVDGYEREDVEYWKKFLKMIKEIEHYVMYLMFWMSLTLIGSLQFQYDDQTLEPIVPMLVSGENIHIPIFQDESIFYSNELDKSVRAQEGRLPLYNQRLKEKLPENERVIMDAQEIIHSEIITDGSWNAQWLIAEVKCTILLFEKLFLGAVAEFIDQSTADGAFVADALNANEMNVKPDGSQWYMYATHIPDDNPKVEQREKVQTTIFDQVLPFGHLNFENVGKEKEQIQKEAELAMSGQDGNGETDKDIHHPIIGSTCCMHKVLSEQADFRSENPLLQIEIEAAGHKCVVYGDQASDAPDDRVGDWFGGSDNINYGFDANITQICLALLVYTTQVSEALTNFDLIIQDQEDSRYNDLAAGTGGNYRYLIPVRQNNQDLFISKLTLVRSASSVDDLFNVTWPGLPQGATGNINAGREGTYLYLSRQLQRAYAL